MKIDMTKEIANAIAQDVANRRMRMGGRKTWNDSDYRTAADELARLYDVFGLNEFDDKATPALLEPD